MGFQFRKSKSFGPFRVTVSKSGISTSVGIKGLRVTKTADGRVKTTASIPGTGIRYTKDITKRNDNSPKRNERETVREEIAQTPPPEATLENAAAFVRSAGAASVADLQREFGIGYTAAAKLMDQLHAAGVVGPYNGGKPREVLF